MARRLVLPNIYPPVRVEAATPCPPEPRRQGAAVFAMSPRSGSLVAGTGGGQVTAGRDKHRAELPICACGHRRLSAKPKLNPSSGAAARHAEGDLR
jgi:hypothetical protein